MRLTIGVGHGTAFPEDSSPTSFAVCTVGEVCPDDPA
jgi:hypothetical protein